MALANIFSVVRNRPVSAIRGPARRTSPQRGAFATGILDREDTDTLLRSLKDREVTLTYFVAVALGCFLGAREEQSRPISVNICVDLRRRLYSSAPLRALGYYVSGVRAYCHPNEGAQQSWREVKRVQGSVRGSIERGDALGAVYLQKLATMCTLKTGLVFGAVMLSNLGSVELLTDMPGLSVSGMVSLTGTHHYGFGLNIFITSCNGELSIGAVIPESLGDSRFAQNAIENVLAQCRSTEQSRWG